MLSAVSTGAPFTNTSAKVSRPANTSSTRSRASVAASTATVVRYSHDSFSIHCWSFSFSR